MKYLYILITNKEEIAEDTEYAKEAPKEAFQRGKEKIGLLFSTGC